MLDHIQAQTSHARRGAIRNHFRYGVDFVLTDFNEEGPALLSRNRFNLWSLQDRDHGGVRGQGHGVAWFRDLLADQGFPVARARLYLLTQPRFLWFHFNPVSFWFAEIDGSLRAFVAEVNSTFGQRHSYFCAHSDFRPIHPEDRLQAQKRMHVSPFQTVAGQYSFRINHNPAEVRIVIEYEHGAEGVVATLQGPRRAATNRALLKAALRRPFGGLRVLALIHWQAWKLWRKRAPFLKKQPAPEKSLSPGPTQDAAAE